MIYIAEYKIFMQILLPSWVNNFIMNLIAALGAYCFFEKKPAIKIRSGLARQIEIA
jgi:hypothetical protein